MPYGFSYYFIKSSARVMTVLRDMFWTLSSAVLYIYLCLATLIIWLASGIFVGNLQIYIPLHLHLQNWIWNAFYLKLVFCMFLNVLHFCWHWWLRCLITLTTSINVTTRIYVLFISVAEIFWMVKILNTYYSSRIFYCTDVFSSDHYFQLWWTFY